MTQLTTLAERINQLLPQTQCTKCGYQGCLPYAQAITEQSAPISLCTPGGLKGIHQISVLLNNAQVVILQGPEPPNYLASIEEDKCIGCTLCIQACPVDAIIGAPKQMHSIISQWCTGCDLCLPPCPVNCITLIQLNTNTQTHADESDTESKQRLQRRLRYESKLLRQQKKSKHQKNSPDDEPTLTRDIQTSLLKNRQQDIHAQKLKNQLIHKSLLAAKRRISTREQSFDPSEFHEDFNQSSDLQLEHMKKHLLKSVLKKKI